MSGNHILIKSHLQKLDKQLIAESFKASADSYEKNAVVQKGIGRKLLKYLKNIDSIDYLRVLEIGCCTGILTEQLVGIGKINTIYLNDIVPEFCSATGTRVAERVEKVEFIPGDIERCPLPTDLGLIVSSATFQWMSDLPVLFGKIHSALHDKGYLVFSIFGPGTMREISDLTGRSLQYVSEEKLSEMLCDTFHIKLLQSETEQMYFSTVREVLKHIRQTGVGGVGRSKWMPGKFKEFEKQYNKHFRSDKGLSVTYASTFVVAQKK